MGSLSQISSTKSRVVATINSNITQSAQQANISGYQKLSRQQNYKCDTCYKLCDGEPVERCYRHIFTSPKFCSKDCEYRHWESTVHP